MVSTAMLHILLLLCAFASTTISAKPKRYCGSITKDSNDSGRIELPNTTMNYTGSEICEVVLYNHYNTKIELRLVNVTSCRDTTQNGYIKISGSRARQWMYCLGGSAPSEHIVTVRSASITITYKTVIENTVETFERNVVIEYRRTKWCRHVLSGVTGVFQNPDYPDYTHNMDCEWKIDGALGKQVVVSFTELSHSPGLLKCDENYVEVRAGRNHHAPLLGKFCLNHWQNFKTYQSNSLFITTKSSNNVGVRFRATYRSTTTCEVVTGHGTEQFSPPSQGLCKKWSLTAVDGQIGALSFTGMRLESTNSQCAGNMLEVWDGENTNIYCNKRPPPSIIISHGGILNVTYHSIKYTNSGNHFEGDFASVSPGKYNNKCYVENKSLYFRCNDRTTIDCDFVCDGAIQCHDNSDENTCSATAARWRKIQVFVIIMGSVCAFTVVFCVGLVFFRKFVLRNNELTDSRGRHYSCSDQAALMPRHADLPSPPPCYFNEHENPPPLIIRGTYFFGNEFSQSSIHNASLFGIPPPRYRSTESVHNQTGEESEQWCSIPLVPTELTALSEAHTGPPVYDDDDGDKSCDKSTSTTSSCCSSTYEPTSIVQQLNTTDDSSTVNTTHDSDIACTLMLV